jgi:hypothetical protein
VVPIARAAQSVRESLGASALGELDERVRALHDVETGVERERKQLVGQRAEVEGRIRGWVRGVREAVEARWVRLFLEVRSLLVLSPRTEISGEDLQRKAWIAIPIAHPCGD